MSSDTDATHSPASLACEASAARSDTARSSAHAPGNTLDVHPRFDSGSSTGAAAGCGLIPIDDRQLSSCSYAAQRLK